MRRATAICWLVCTLLLAGNMTPTSGASTSGTASTRDAATTLAYLRAEIRIERALVSHLPASRSAVAALEHEVAAGCPRVLAHAPREKQLGETNTAIYLTAFAAVLQPDRQTLQSALRRIKSLRWNDGRLMRLVARQRRLELTESKLEEPDLCGAARAWVASSYHRLPASIATLDRAFQRIIKAEGKDLSSEPGIQSLLERYESAEARKLARRLAMVEREADGSHLKRLLNSAYSTLSDDLGVRPSA